MESDRKKIRQPYEILSRLGYSEECSKNSILILLTRKIL